MTADLDHSSCLVFPAQGGAFAASDDTDAHRRLFRSHLRACLEPLLLEMPVRLLAQIAADPDRREAFLRLLDSGFADEANPRARPRAVSADLRAALEMVLAELMSTTARPVHLWRPGGAECRS